MPEENKPGPTDDEMRVFEDIFKKTPQMDLPLEMERVEGLPELNLDDLKVGQVITLEAGETFLITKVNEDERSPEAIKSDRTFPTAKAVYVQGSTFGGSVLKKGIVKEGMQLEMYVIEAIKAAESKGMDPLSANRAGTYRTPKITGFKIEDDQAQSRRILIEIEPT